MSKTRQYRSEIFLPAVGMLVVAWHETIHGSLKVDEVEGTAGNSRNCLYAIAGFEALLLRAIALKTQKIKAACNGEHSQALPY